MYNAKAKHICANNGYTDLKFFVDGHEAAIMPGITSGGFGSAFDGSSVLKDIAKEILLMTSRHFKPQYYFWTAILMARNLLVIVLIRTVPSDRKCSLCRYLSPILHLS